MSPVVSTVHALAASVGAAVQPDPQPEDNSVVAGWVAAVVFVFLIVAVVVICRSLVTRLRNVDHAAQEGLYDPSDPRVEKERQRRGLGAHRPPVV